LGSASDILGNRHDETGEDRMLWDLYQSYRISQLEGRLSSTEAAKTQDAVARDAAVRLEEKVDRLALICRAMFELVQETSGITEEQLRKRIVDVDLRDGQSDGRMTRQAKRCPKCEAAMSPQFGRCLFCGYKDESRAF
jgi:hypothetical protein